MQGRARRQKGKTKSQVAASPQAIGHRPSPAAVRSPGPSPAWQEPQPRAQHTEKWTWAPRQWPVAEEGPWGHTNLSVHLSTATRSSSCKHESSSHRGLCCLHACKVPDTVRSAFSLNHPNSAVI